MNCGNGRGDDPLKPYHQEKTRAILLFKIKIKLIEMFELNERMPGMQSAEYQATIPRKFFIIIHNYVNV